MCENVAVEAEFLEPLHILRHNRINDGDATRRARVRDDCKIGGERQRRGERREAALSEAVVAGRVASLRVEEL